MSRASLVELTNLCVICDGSRVLVQDKIGCGVVFPGGHVEPGESMPSPPRYWFVTVSSATMSNSSLMP